MEYQQKFDYILSVKILDLLGSAIARIILKFFYFNLENFTKVKIPIIIVKLNMQYFANKLQKFTH